MDTPIEFAVLKNCLIDAVAEQQSRVPDCVRFYTDEHERDLHVFWSPKSHSLAGSYVMTFKDLGECLCVEYGTTGDLPIPWRMTLHLSLPGQYGMRTARWLLEPLLSLESTDG